jgi:acyl transferase domain-containing protein
MPYTLDDKIRDLLKNSTLEIRTLRKQLKSAEQRLTHTDQRLHAPIAIIGMACRFPGGATDPRAYWDLLEGGRHGIVEVPEDRWDRERWTPSARYLGAIADVDKFDAELFGISPSEASCMDPQQRLVLELSWEALENANVSIDTLAGSSTGVFVGACNVDYRELGVPALPYSLTGVAASVIAGRVSYTFGLRGPSVVVDTACSSSLVALHLAIQALRLGECDLALVGGVNTVLVPGSTMCLSKMHALSPRGRCNAFDASADGYVRGEGCGMLVLKRAQDAERDRNSTLAIVRGSAVNHDGYSHGLTAPSGPSQELVIRKALENAGIEPSDIDYVEMHGTGTPLGDPIELNALTRVVGRGRAKDAPVLIGSVKANVGHLEAAAGVASVIKTVLMLQHGRLLPQLGFETPTPHVEWQDLNVRVVEREQPWPTRGRPGIAGVSGFAFSGTNAHVVLQGANLPEHAAASAQRSEHILKLSAHQPIALRELAQRYAALLEHEASFADVCHSANSSRSDRAHRLALVARDSPSARQQLLAFVTDRLDSVQPWRGRAPRAAPQIAFVFAGHGHTVHGLGRELYASEPVYRAAFDACSDALQSRLGHSLAECMYGSAPDPVDPQLATFSFEYALCELWRSWGVEPDVVLGEGTGALAAACVAGVFDLERSLLRVLEPSRTPSVPANEPQLRVISDANAARGVRTILESGVRLFIELGPQAALADAARACESSDAVWLRGEDCSQLLASLAQLYVAGVKIDWPAVGRPFAARSVALPNYPFSARRHWVPRGGETGPVREAPRRVNGSEASSS